MLEFFKLIPIIVMIIFLCMGVGIFLLINKIFKWFNFKSFNLPFTRIKIIYYEIIYVYKFIIQIIIGGSHNE